MIYLDNNATSRMAPDVRDYFAKWLGVDLANPSSQHRGGRIAKRYLDEAVEKLSAAVSAQTEFSSADTVIWTSGGTEANNLALSGLAAKREGSIVVTSIEHPSILGVAEQLMAIGKNVRYLPVTSSGIIRLDVLESWIADHRRAVRTEDRIGMVSVMAANNETGILQPMEEVVRICKPEGILVHTDAVQAFGKVRFSFSELGIDAMTITSHKIYGPVGIGALILRNGVPILPSMFGGFQQMAIRPGTEPVALASTFAFAAQRAVEELSSRSLSMAAMRDHLENRLISAFPYLKVIGQDVPRLPNTSSIAFMKIDRQVLQMAFDLQGLACSTGSACASGSSQPSHVLKAMQIDDTEVSTALRFSLSPWTTDQEIDDAFEIMARVLRSKTKGLA